MAQITFDPSEGPTQQEKDAEAAALAQGEKLQIAQDQDKARQFDQEKAEQETPELIGGKFKSQEDLLKAYQELEKQRTKENQGEEDTEEEDSTDVLDETAEPEPESDGILNRAADEYQKDGTLSEEAIDELSKMDSKDLIKAYVDFYTRKSTAASIENDQLTEIKSIAGGDEGYTELVGWAAENLEQHEIEAFNDVTNSNNVSAIKFAVEALKNRYQNKEGYEAPLITGSKSKSSTSGIKPYRSQAELARDIANPKYSSDPAFRQDIEARLQVSQNLL